MFGRRGRAGERPRAGALGVPDRRRVRLAALRLRAAAPRPPSSSIERRGQRASSIYLRGHEGRGIGLGHKIRAYRLQERGPRHGRRQPRARTPGRQPGVRHRRADAGRPRRDHHADHDQQPGQVRRPRGLRPRHRRARPARIRRPTPRTSRTCAPSASASGTSSPTWTGSSRTGTTGPVTGSEETRLDPGVFAAVAPRVGRQVGEGLLAEAGGRGLRIGIACALFNGGITRPPARRRAGRARGGIGRPGRHHGGLGPGCLRAAARRPERWRARAPSTRWSASARSSGATRRTSTSSPASARRASPGRARHRACRSSSGCSPPTTWTRRSSGRGPTRRTRAGRPPSRRCRWSRSCAPSPAPAGAGGRGR